MLKSNVVRILIFTAVFFLSSVAVFSYTDPEYDTITIRGGFFVLLEPAGPFEPEVYDEEKAIRQLLEEARYVFSAMIYGFNFVYIPKDSLRGVEEEFSFAPVHTIPWGDSGLRVTDGRYKNGRYDAEISYEISKDQVPWVVSWETSVLPAVTAVGEGPLFSGMEGKKEAIGNSVKESLRNYLRPRIYDKPRRISGLARLSEVPYITMDAGNYICKARVTLRLEEILEYEIY